MLNLAERKIRVSFLPKIRKTGDTKSPMEFIASVETPKGDFVSSWSVGVGNAKGFRVSGKYTVYQHNKFKAGIAAYKPSGQDLIVHILAFADALELTFSEWADNLGLSDDSIQARRDYMQYQEQCMIIRRVLGKDFEKIREWSNEQ